MYNQDIPIRPRYGYVDENDASKEDTGECHNKAATSYSKNNIATASSYTEIPFLAQYSGQETDNMENNEIRAALNTSLNSRESYLNLDSGEDEDDENTKSKESDCEESNIMGRTKPLQCESTVPHEFDSSTTSKLGEMRHFVAHDLEAKLRERPLKSSIDFELTTSSTSMVPGVMARRLLQSRDVPEVDGSVLVDIELEAQYLATAVDNLIENLSNLLHSISALTADNVEVHKNAVHKLTDTLDANIKCMYTIMAKTEEISKSMKPSEQLGQRIREIKRLVDMLDSTM